MPALSPQQAGKGRAGGPLYRSSSAPPATSYGTLRAMQVWWSTQTALQALVSGGKLWLMEAPENAAVLPYLTYSLVSDDAAYTTGFAYRVTVYQFNVHHFNSARAESLAWTISRALNTVSPGGGAVLTIRGQTSVHVLTGQFGTTFGDGLAAGGRDCWVRTFKVMVPWTGS